MRKQSLLKYGLTVLLSGLLVWYFVSLRDVGNQPLAEQYRIWCDAFFVPGGVLVMVGVLVKLSEGGIFDGLGYALRTAAQSLIPGGRYGHERYGDYVARKKEKRQDKPLRVVFLFVVGGIFLAVSLVFMILFYRIYGKTAAF